MNAHESTKQRSTAHDARRAPEEAGRARGEALNRRSKGRKEEKVSFLGNKITHLTDLGNKSDLDLVITTKKKNKRQKINHRNDNT